MLRSPIHTYKHALCAILYLQEAISALRVEMAKLVPVICQQVRLMSLNLSKHGKCLTRWCDKIRRPRSFGRACMQLVPAMLHHKRESGRCRTTPFLIWDFVCLCLRL